VVPRGTPGLSMGKEGGAFPRRQDLPAFEETAQAQRLVVARMRVAERQRLVAEAAEAALQAAA
jgi:hypothetical protein